MKIFLIVVFAVASLLAAHADANWTADYKAALVQARAQNKLVLLDFTGSDWCSYCKLFDAKVLTQQAFIDFASQNYILVKVDFPHQIQLPEDLQKQNNDLATQFAIRLHPTLVVVDADGKELGRDTGYHPDDGPDAVIARLKRFSKD